MAEPTKIFISSASQGSFFNLRQTVFDDLKQAGHDPIMFEQNMGPWQQNAVQRCTDTVKQCEVFLLFLAEKSGTVLNSGVSVTHMEFLTAYENNKEILIFADDQVKNTYFSVFHRKISAYVENFKVENPRDPSHQEIKNEISKILTELGDDERLNGIENYMWSFFADLVIIKDFYIENLKKYGSINETIKKYLSDILKNGVFYLSMEEEIHQNAKHASQYSKYEKLVNQQITLLKEGKIDNWRAFLSNLAYPLEGGAIKKTQEEITVFNLGEYNRCDLITLYRRQENLLKLVEYYGSLSKFDSFKLDDDNSFVVSTYNTGGSLLFFVPEKNTLYLVKKAGEFVICFHYPLVGSLTIELFNQYEKEIFDVIIKSESEIYRNFAVSLLGGINHDE